jgi:hypothetical protein
MEFTYELYLQLKKEYGIAVKEQKQTFMFEGHLLLTDYAKYLIEYLDSQYKQDKKK